MELSDRNQTPMVKMPAIDVTEIVYEKIENIKAQKGAKNLSDAINIILERNEVLETYYSATR